MAHLNGVDVSGWQKGINLAALQADFAVVKATEGTSFISNDYIRQANQTLESGKLLGIYHYVNGAGAAAEARHFYNNIKPYVKRAIIVIDWESGGNKAWGNLNYLESFIVEIKNLTGITPMIYASASVFPWALCSKHGCTTWVAQYANNARTGYQTSPWNEGKYKCDMRQYSSSGSLAGWNGNLDINKFYGDRAKWQLIAGQFGGASTQPQPKLEEWEMATKQEVAQEVKSTILTAPADSGIGDMSMETVLMWTNSDTKNIKEMVTELKRELCDPYKSSIDGTVGDVHERLLYVDYRIQQMYEVLIPTMNEAIKALADAKGADGETIAAEVAAAVKEKLESISLKVKVGE